MANTVIGIFDNENDALNAVEKLEDNGYESRDIDVAPGNDISYSDTDFSGKVNNTAGESESGVARFFKNLFGNNDESERYTKAAISRHIVTVHTQTIEDAQRASILLDEYGAVDVDEDYSDVQEDSYTGTERTGAGQNVNQDNNRDTGKTIKVVEENLQVGKREVETGNVRVRSRIIEIPVEESLRLRTDRVNIQRRKVDRLATPDDLAEIKEETIELKEKKEVPVVSKESRVVEEISIENQAEENEEKIRDTVRRVDVDIEGTDSENARAKE